MLFLIPLVHITQSAFALTNPITTFINIYFIYSHFKVETHLYKLTRIHWIKLNVTVHNKLLYSWRQSFLN